MPDTKKQMQDIREAYVYAESQKAGDRLTRADVENAKKVLKVRKVYENAKKNKDEDRLTQRDIKMAEKSVPEFSSGGMAEYIKDLL